MGALRLGMNDPGEGITTANRETLYDLTDLLVHELERAEDGEGQAAEALRRYGTLTENLRLRRLLEQRIYEGERVGSDIRSALELHSSSYRPLHNAAVRALISQTDMVLQSMATPALRDVVIITGAQRLQSYCLACLATLQLLATLLEDRETAQTISAASEEGRRWDRQLTELALYTKNRQKRPAAV